MIGVESRFSKFRKLTDRLLFLILHPLYDHPEEYLELLAVPFWTEIRRIAFNNVMSPTLCMARHRFCFELYIRKHSSENFSRFNHTHFYNDSGIINQENGCPDKKSRLLLICPGNHYQESLKLTDLVVFNEAVISNIDGKLK